MPFRDRFDCLWCGTPWATRGPNDLEGWAQLCPDCLGKAGTNPFLRTRLRSAITERAVSSASADGSAPERETDVLPEPPPDRVMVDEPGSAGPTTLARAVEGERIMVDEPAAETDDELDPPRDRA